MLGVHEVTTNVTVGCAINKPVVVPIALNDILHDAIGMNECSADHGWMMSNYSRLAVRPSRYVLR